jgi:hypothetical protein
MEWFRWLVAWGRSKVDKRVRRVIVVVLEGLEAELVDRYLEQGLLHNLALLSDIGTRAALGASRANLLETLSTTAASNHLRSVVLPAVPMATAIDLHSICAADRAQQERLVAALSRRRTQVVAAVFDMPLQLVRLFGPHPQSDPQLILRDVYARMDEVVGKAFSFVDETTVLLAVVPERQRPEPVAQGPVAGLLYVSRPWQPQKPDGTPVSQLVLELLGVSHGI